MCISYFFHGYHQTRDYGIVYTSAPASSCYSSIFKIKALTPGWVLFHDRGWKIR